MGFLLKLGSALGNYPVRSPARPMGARRDRQAQILPSTKFRPILWRRSCRRKRFAKWFAKPKRWRPPSALRASALAAPRSGSAVRFVLRHRGSSSGDPALEAGVDRQPLPAGSPGLRAFVSNGFVRGLCSGLGLLDIWIGFWEAVHFHDDKSALNGKTTSS